eukprot:CAMPEP_0194693896 /NCGR_PEP_ID=MMETSP0295-20121207/20863_1 /TAXON_ID=39354 /ORGANISM="Heterosigma akashiwo, Strain CCMP2393" /LENGTH=93 /DNA_ID=CAMNT_0039584983 /DNA_START=1 /DNA_END=279 /DNA_ORIENTATION=-
MMAEPMAKAEFISVLAEKTGLPKSKTDQIVKAAFEVLVDEVAEKKEVNLPGFGSFRPSARAAREGRNPRTGEKVQIAASYAPTFGAAKAFKDK